MGERFSDSRHPAENEELPGVQEGDRKYLRLVGDAYRSSTDFLDDGIRNEWEKAYSRFHSEHPTGSKYHHKNYKYRSKIFRPKTRSLSRRAEAKAARALFSNTDLINVRGQNKGSAEQAAAARLHKSLLQFHLEHSVPWFVTAMGARQDAFNTGVCISLQTWRYEVEEVTELRPAFNPETGEPEVDEDGNELGEEVLTGKQVRKDHPDLMLFPPENVRFDQNADWRNPFEDSPVITMMMPMFIDEVMQRMEASNPVTGEPEWRQYTEMEIFTASRDLITNESIRQARQGRERQDPADSVGQNKHQPVWVWLNIVREDGKDLAYYTLGEHRMLTDPRPVDEVLPLGRESLTFGFSIVESHRPYPIGGNRLAAPLQAELNDVANQRMDNVRLSMNKRFKLKRGSNVDQAALLRSTPGGGIMVTNMDDLQEMEYSDVTGSSYQEQDRLAQELDELTGNFSSSSVQSNRSLNETVGGMNMLQGDASEVAEYELRVFVETWVEPVLRKMQKLIAMFETDQTIMTLAAENGEVYREYGQNVDLDYLLDQELVVSVNVGMGNTNPQQRLQQFQMIVAAAANIPEVGARLNPEEIGKEIFSLGGFNETERFFRSEEEMEEIAAQQQPQAEPAIEAAKIRAEAQAAASQSQAETARYKADKDFEAAMARLAQEEDLTYTELFENLGIQDEKMKTERQIKAIDAAVKQREMNLARDTGSGI